MHLISVNLLLNAWQRGDSLKVCMPRLALKDSNNNVNGGLQNGAILFYNELFIHAMGMEMKEMAVIRSACLNIDIYFYTY